MLVKFDNGLIYHDRNYFYCNDNDFMLEGINYERDLHNGRCYRLRESCCLKSDCDGKLVRVRISNTEYFMRLARLKSMMPTKGEAEQYKKKIK